MFSNFFSSNTPSADDGSKPLIVITGISGYIGSQILNYCVSNLADSYRIRGTARNPNDYDKMEPLYSYMGGEEALLAKVEIVSADLQDNDSIDAAVAGATYVIHTSSPVGINEPDDPNYYILPAVEGTLSVMRAALKHGVKRVVMTSSIAAVETQSEETMESDPVLDETYWSELDSGQRIAAYSRSKTVAEKAAWDFLKEIPNGQPKPELVTILPGLVLGEFICGGISSSPALIKSIIQNSLPGIPRIVFSAVDMDDVVQAHIKGLFTPEAAGERFIIVKQNIWLVDICQMCQT